MPRTPCVLLCPCHARARVFSDHATHAVYVGIVGLAELRSDDVWVAHVRCFAPLPHTVSVLCAPLSWERGRAQARTMTRRDTTSESVRTRPSWKSMHVTVPPPPTTTPGPSDAQHLVAPCSVARAVRPCSTTRHSHGHTGRRPKTGMLPFLGRGPAWLLWGVSTDTRPRGRD